MNEIVAYWNGAQLRDLFEAIVFIVGGSDFLGLLRTVAVFGLLIMTTMAVLRQRAIEPMAYIAALALFYTLMLVPKMTLTIKDVRSNQSFVVANVPYGVGVFASASSHIGKWLTDTFEAAFAPTDALKFSKFGVVYPQRLLSTMQSIGPVTPKGREMLSNFVKDCVTPELVDNSAKTTQLINAPDIWGTIKGAGWLNPARFTIDSAGDPISCTASAADIDNYLTQTELPEMQKYVGMKLLPDQANPSAAIATTLPQAESELLNMARSLQLSLTQSAMLDAIPNGIAVSGAQGQPLQIAINLAARQANLASDVNYRSMADVARDSLPKLRNTVEFIIIASFPLMLIMVIAAGHYAGTMLRTYFVMLLWVQLWAPLYAVLNYLVISTDKNPLSQLVAAYGGNTLASAGMIQATGASSAAIAGGLTVLIPVIAYYLASRAEIAASSMVSSIMQPAQSAGGAMATQAAQGNVSMGRVSWGDVSMNNTSSGKMDANTTASSGVFEGGVGAVSYRSDARLGTGWVNASKAQDDLGPVTARQTQESAVQAQFEVARAQARETSAAQSYGEAVRGMFSSLASYGDNRTLQSVFGWDNSVRDAGTTTVSAGRGATAGDNLESADRVADGTRVAGGLTASAGVSAGAGATGAGVGASANAGVNASAIMAKDKSNTDALVQRYQQDEGFRRTVDQAVAGAAVRNEGQRGESGQRASRELRGSLERVQDAQNRYQVAKSEREAVQQVASEMSRTGATTAVNAAGAIAGALGSVGIDALVTGAGGSRPGATLAGTHSRNESSWRNDAVPPSGVAGPDRDAAAKLQRDVERQALLASVMVAGGSQAAEDYARQSIGRAYRQINPDVNEGQPVSVSSQAQALINSAIDGNAQAVAAVQRLRDERVISFDQRFDSLLPSLPKDRTKPAETRTENAAYAAP